MKPAAPNILIFFIFSMLFLIVASFSITGIAAPYIVSDLGGDRYIATYGMTFFGFGAAITIPIAKALASRLGEVKTYIILGALFALANLFCALAPTFFLFIAARVFTGMCAGPIYPLMTNIFSSLIPEEKKGTIFWIMVTILVVIPSFAAAWGGVVAYLYNWRALFYWNAALAFAATLFLGYLLKGAPIAKMRRSFDWSGWVFYAIGIFGLMFPVATAQQLDWYRSNLLIASSIIGTIAFSYFLIRSVRHTAPVMDFSLLRKPIFSFALICMAVLFGIYFGLILLLGNWLTFDVRFTPDWIGVLIGSMGIAGLFPRFIIGSRLGKFDPRIWIGLAIALLGISCFYSSIFNSEINFGRIAFSRVIAGFGVALFLPPVFQIMSEAHPPEKWISVFELFQIVRNLACSIGAATLMIAWQRRTVFYHERLNETLSRQSLSTQEVFATAKIYDVPGDPNALLNDLLDMRASALALDDVFYLMGWILTALTALLLLTYLSYRKLFNINIARWRQKGC